MQSPDVLCCLQTGPCVTAAGLENVNRTQCLVTRRELFEACQTASPCPFVWVVFSRCFGGDGVLACGSRSGDIYPRLKQSATFMARMSYSPHLHQGEEQVSALHLLDFQVLYNGPLCYCTQYTLAWNTSCERGKSSRPARTVKVCDVLAQTGVKAFYIFRFLF